MDDSQQVPEEVSSDDSGQTENTGSEEGIQQSENTDSEDGTHRQETENTVSSGTSGTPVYTPSVSVVSSTEKYEPYIYFSNQNYAYVGKKTVLKVKSTSGTRVTLTGANKKAKNKKYVKLKNGKTAKITIKKKAKKGTYKFKATSAKGEYYYKATKTLTVKVR